mgnify:CR=1 FL=1
MNKGNRIRLIVIDVDGTMTDSGIYYDEQGYEIKKFCTKDAAGFFAAHAVGIKIMVLTGRECAATTKRMQEMKVDFLFQDVKDKSSFLKDFIDKKGYDKHELAYIGDDLNDYPSMKQCGFVACPADSCQEVLEISNYTSPIKGGHGAVRDVIEYILRETGLWEMAISEVYNVGV